MFIYHKSGLSFPATQQISHNEWVLEHPFWHRDDVTGEITLIPPSGLTPQQAVKNPVWKTDYRSGPSIPSLDKQGHYSAAWLKHDFGYASEGYHPAPDGRQRSRIDWELLCDLEELGANWFQRNRVYLAVRAGGGFVYRKHDPYEVAKLRIWHSKCQAAFTCPMPIL